MFIYLYNYLDWLAILAIIYPENYKNIFGKRNAWRIVEIMYRKINRNLEDYSMQKTNIIKENIWN